MISLIIVVGLKIDFYSQNLISNPSFSETKNKINDTLRYEFTDLVDWYSPNYYNKYIHPNYQNRYYTSKDKNLNLKKSYITNQEVLFYDNLGCLSIELDKTRHSSFIQQRLLKKIDRGMYCFKIKYKTNQFSAENKLQIAITKSNLKSYYTHRQIILDPRDIKISIFDTFKLHSPIFNMPWNQKCSVINLNGNEKYFSISNFEYKKSFLGEPFANYFIDDIELFKIKDSLECECKKYKKDSIINNTITFPLNKEIETDSLKILSARYFYHEGDIITPEAKQKLDEIISFMQNNKEVTLELINHINEKNYSTDFDPFYNKSDPFYNECYYDYLRYYGIKDERIKVKRIKLNGNNPIYSNPTPIFIKVSFIFHYKPSAQR